MFDLRKLDELKNRLATAAEFADVMEYFFDHFGDSPTFMRLGKRIKSPLIDTMLDHIGGQLMGAEVRVTAKHYVRLKKQRFVHGKANIDGHMSVFFYFRELDMGLLTCQVGRESRTARFTLFRVKEGDAPADGVVFPVPRTRGVTN